MKILLVVLGVCVLGVALWYFISPLFITISINDESPIPANPVEMPSGVERLSPEEKVALEEAMTEATESNPTKMTESTPTTQPVVSQLSEVMGTTGHPAEGTVQVIETETGSVIRFEDFSTINGPQLHLYLAKNLEATEYIDLGPIRGTQGNINYTVPADVDLSEYQYVLHWCVPFGILFNYANIGN